jgi:hypothetical protein
MARLSVGIYTQQGFVIFVMPRDKFLSQFALGYMGFGRCADCVSGQILENC